MPRCASSDQSRRQGIRERGWGALTLALAAADTRGEFVQRVEDPRVLPDPSSTSARALGEDASLREQRQGAIRGHRINGEHPLHERGINDRLPHEQWQQAQPSGLRPHTCKELA
ncbi:hypothetical protein ACFPRL_09330 [Pseudoclavibacter helvolus]